MENSIFLAGPTVRGNQPHLRPSWREAAIEEFRKQGFQGTLILPEFIDPNKTDKDIDELPIWEIGGMTTAKVVLFWIPRTKELIGLCTNAEFGYWLAKNPEKMVYGRPDGSYRTKYNDILWRELHLRGQVPTINKTLQDTVKSSIYLYNEKKND